MHLPRIRILYAVTRHVTSQGCLHSIHSRTCCISSFRTNGYKHRPQQTNTRRLSTQSYMTISSANTYNYIFFSSLLSKRAYCSKPALDPITSLPLHDPKKGDLVYGGPLAKMIKGVKTFSLSTSLIGLCLQPYLLLHAESQPLVAKIAVGTTVSFFVFVTPLMIHFVSKKYVTDCYYNKNTNEFIATTISLFLRRKELKFTPEDVVVPDVPGMFTSIIVKGRPLFMDPKFFYSREAYIQMMGYDKPLEWELPGTLEENQSAEKPEKS